MADKIFCGSGKAFGQYGQIGINICFEDIPQEYIKSSTNGKRYIKLKVCSRKTPDRDGNTHYIEVDTWKPNNQQSAPSSAPQQTGQLEDPQQGEDNFSWDDLTDEALIGNHLNSEPTEEEPFT
jgi:hypothetical protein